MNFWPVPEKHPSANDSFEKFLDWLNKNCLLVTHCLSWVKMQKLTSLCEALKEERDELQNECNALQDDVNSLHHLLNEVKSRK